MNRLGLKISCVVVSIVIWFWVASTTETTQTVNLPLRIIGLQEELTVAGSTVPREVKVRLTTSKLRLLAYRTMHRGDLGWVALDVGGRGPAPSASFPLTPANVRTIYREPAPTVVAPLAVELRIDRRLSRRLPVRLVTEGSLGEGMQHVTPPWTLPDSVLATGPETILGPVTEVVTEPVDLGRVTGNRAENVALAPPAEHVVLDTEEVVARFEVGRVAERFLANLVVTALVDAGQPPVAVSPPTVGLRVRGVERDIEALTQHDLIVTVSASALAPGVHRLPVEVQAPPSITLLDVPSVTVIVGDLPAGKGNGGGRE